MNTIRLSAFSFIPDESGAVTVDWIVLTAAVVGLGAAVMTSVGKGTTDLALSTETALKVESVSTAADFGPYTRRLLLNRIKGNKSFAKGMYLQARSLKRKIDRTESEEEAILLTMQWEQKLAEHDEYRRQEAIWRERLNIFDADAAAAAAEAEAAEGA